MKKDVLHSNHLAEKKATRISIFLKIKSARCEELPKGLAVKGWSSDALEALTYNVQ